MTSIPATAVRALRERTGAGMMDCKKALAATGGETEAAIDWLRRKGLAAAAGKSGRVTPEGLAGFLCEGNTAAIIELNTETDFVARNAGFQELAQGIARVVLTHGDDPGTVGRAPFPGSDRSVSDEILFRISTLGEHISLRRTGRIQVARGVPGGYAHAALVPGFGKIAVIVSLETDSTDPRIAGFARKLAMHIAAAAPVAVSREALDPDTVARERSICLDQARASGKPESVIERMVEGRMEKFLAGIVLPEQEFVFDNTMRVGDALARLGEETGSPVRVGAFLRYALGEGAARTPAGEEPAGGE